MPRTPRWLKAASFGVHVVVVLLLMVLPITAALDLPGIYTRLPTVMLASVPSMPPEPPPPAAAAPVASTVQAVPLEAPEGIREEIPRPAPTATVGVPGGMPVTGDPTAFTRPLNEGTSLAPQLPPPVKPRPVGGDVRPPERLVFKAPAYPPLAQAARIEGTVILEAVIDARGVVQDVTVLRSVPMLDRAAIDAVKQWRYTPTRLNGVAIPVRMSITVTFSMRQWE